MDNISLIKEFLKKDNGDKLIINQLSEEVGIFYKGVITYFCEEMKIKIVQNQKQEHIETKNLFEEISIQLYYSNNKKIIENILKKKGKVIIISDYKTFKHFIKSILCVNGYEYYKDIKYFIKNELNIDNSDIIDFCKECPPLAFSEVSKYLVNSEGYIKESLIKENNNFMLAIRKELYNLKMNRNNFKSIYENIKNEARYKKFSFLTF